jgi:hypothetical protein
MKRPVFFLFFLITVSSALAQGLHQIGISSGLSYYNGELNPTAQFPGGSTYFSWGMVHRKPLNSRWTWKNNIFIGKVSGDDAAATEDQRLNRNLNFSSDIYEFMSQIEFNFFNYHPFVTRDKFTPYLGIGMGFFYMNPTATLNGNTFELRQYGTEGQTKAYSRVQFALPVDFGIKWKLNHRFMFSLSWGWRKTFTDYIDDVSGYYPEDPSALSTLSQALSNKSLDNGNADNSWGMQRGEPGNKDSYSFTMLSILVRIGKNPNLCKFNTY